MSTQWKSNIHLGTTANAVQQFGRVLGMSYQEGVLLTLAQPERGCAILVGEGGDSSTIACESAQSYLGNRNITIRCYSNRQR